MKDEEAAAKKFGEDTDNLVKDAAKAEKKRKDAKEADKAFEAAAEKKAIVEEKKLVTERAARLRNKVTGTSEDEV